MSKEKIYFDKDIDNRIAGFAVSLTFIIAGLLLQFLPIYFGNKTVTTAVKWIFVIFGILGFFVEAGKTKIKIIGLDDILLGITFIGIWFALYWFGKHWILNIIGFIFLIFGLFGFLQGAQKTVYSISKISQTKKTLSTEEKKTDIVLFITKIIGLLLAIIQIAKAIIDLSIAF